MASIPTEIKALIWDLDGTILDSFGIYVSLMHQVAPAFGLPLPSEQALRDSYHGSLPDSIQDGLGGVLSPSQLDAFVAEFLAKQPDHYLEVESHLIADGLDLSQRATARGLKQAIVTNRDHAGRGNASPRFIAANTSLKDHIHEVISGDDLDGIRKPDPRVVSKLLQTWQLQPSQVMVIGDQHVDAQLALNIGCKAIIVVRDGAELAHAHKLDKGWQEHVAVVESLADVTV